MKYLKKYSLFIISLIVLAIVFFINKTIGNTSITKTISYSKQMLIYLPPIFILIGLLDVWVDKDTMVYLMGENSGIKGIFISILAGSCTAGPLYGAFPVVAVFMKKGVKFSNILIFLGTWSCAKIAMVLFEIATLGAKFAFTRLLIDIPGIIILSLLIARFIPKEQIDKLYQNMEENN